jgi:hypothetical protein
MIVGWFKTDGMFVEEENLCGMELLQLLEKCKEPP